MLDVEDRYHGSPPCRWTMCKGQCEGTGWTPENVLGGHQWVECPDCHGTGRRIGGLPGRALEFVFGFFEPLNFAWFWWRKYGWEEGNGVSGAFRMLWQDNARFRSFIFNV